jgi:glycine/sarcosine N-methyltransferase
MIFYDSLVQVYDELFPLNPATVSFIAQPPRQDALAVDLGCATGSHSLALAKGSWRVAGLEPAEGMLAEARKQAAELGLDKRAEFRQAGMLEMSASIKAGSAALVLCIGNTLPHLRDEHELALFFKEAAQALEVGGRLILQTLNYQKILAQKPAKLPDLRLGDKVFTRRYRYRSDGAIDFLTSFGPKTAGERPENSVRLYPFSPGAIVAAADRQGFLPRGIYASWTEEDFDPQASDILILDLLSPRAGRR